MPAFNKAQHLVFCVPFLFPYLHIFTLKTKSKMAEFCNTCAKQWGMETDIDIYRIHRRLKKGYQQSILCEGCEIIAV